MRTFTFSAISSILTATITTIYDAGGKPATADALNGNRCQYNGIGCPSTTYLGPGAVGSLSALELAAQRSLSVAACEKTINMTEATAESYISIYTRTLFAAAKTTYTDASGSLHTGTYQGSKTGYTVITSMASRRPEERVGCCGVCYLTYSNVDVHYFPPPEFPAGSSCVPNTWRTSTTMAARNSSQVPGRHATTFVNSDGYTL